MEELVVSNKPKSVISVLFGKRSARIGLAILVAIAAFVIIGSLTSSYAPNAISGMPNQPPSLAHPLGTDYQGHDLLSQITWGAYPSMGITLEAAAGAVLIGFLVGVLGGYFDKLDGILSGVTDITLTLPALAAILLIAALFKPTNEIIAFLLTIFLWAPVARAVRIQVSSVKKLMFVDTAKLSGTSDIGIVFKVIVPQVASIAFAYFIVNLSVGVVLATALEFLGVGNVVAVSWGSILYWAQLYAFEFGDWWWIIEPGILISVIAFATAMIGFSVEEVMNPRLRSE